MTERFEKGKCINALPLTFVCLDTETTGLSSKKDRIIELSAIKYVNGVQTEVFDRLIKVPFSLALFTVQLTGITDRLLAEKGEEERRVLSDFLRFTQNLPVVGHNVDFDIRFLYDRCMASLGVPFSNNYIDTLRLSRSHNKSLRHHSLDDLAEYYHIPPRTLHRALGDVQITTAVYFCLRRELARPVDPLPFVED